MPVSPGTVTMKMLARRLNLSAGSVSKALQDSHEISAETKRRVRAMAAELRYVPNHFAAGLRKKKSKTIAVVVPEIADSYFAQAINGIEAVAQANGYQVIISLTNELLSKEQEIFQSLASGHADGVLVSVSRETDSSHHLRELVNKGFPVIFFDRVAEDMETVKVVTNDFDSGYAAGKHFAELGCRRICFLSMSETEGFARLRLDGLNKALRENGLAAAEVLVCSTDTAVNDRLIKKRLSARPLPDSMLASVELLAIPVYKACQALGINIPGKLKLIAFSNLSTATLLNPSLTTITQPAFEMGQTAATLLCRVLEKRTPLPNQKIVQPSRLEVRGSTVRPQAVGGRR